MKPLPVSIPAGQVIDLVKELLKFPYPQICRHLVAADLLDLLERNGWSSMTIDLARAVVGADDAEALAILEKIQPAPS